MIAKRDVVNLARKNVCSLQITPAHVLHPYYLPIITQKMIHSQKPKITENRKCYSPTMTISTLSQPASEGKGERRDQQSYQKIHLFDTATKNHPKMQCFIDTEDTGGYKRPPTQGPWGATNWSSNIGLEEQPVSCRVSMHHCSTCTCQVMQSKQASRQSCVT